MTAKNSEKARGCLARSDARDDCSIALQFGEGGAGRRDAICLRTSVHIDLRAHPNRSRFRTQTRTCRGSASSTSGMVCRRDRCTHAGPRWRGSQQRLSPLMVGGVGVASSRVRDGRAVRLIRWALDRSRYGRRLGAPRPTTSHTIATRWPNSARPETSAPTLLIGCSLRRSRMAILFFTRLRGSGTAVAPATPFDGLADQSVVAIAGRFAIVSLIAAAGNSTKRRRNHRNTDPCAPCHVVHSLSRSSRSLDLLSIRLSVTTAARHRAGILAEERWAPFFPFPRTFVSIAKPPVYVRHEPIQAPVVHLQALFPYTFGNLSAMPSDPGPTRPRRSLEPAPPRILLALRGSYPQEDQGTLRKG